MNSQVEFSGLAAEWGRVQTQQMLMVGEGLRSGCRLRISRDQLPRMAYAADRLSLKMLVGFDTVALMPLEGRTGFSEWGRRARLSPSNRSDCYVYLCRDHIHGQRLRRSDEAGDDTAVGELLDYPTCCIKAFGDLLAQPALADPVIFRYADNGDIAWPMNVSLFCFDRAVLSHVPCSPACGASRDLAVRYYDFLLTLSPGEAAELKRALSTRVLHTHTLGVAAFTAVERGARLEVEEVLAVDANSVLGKLLVQGCSIARESDGVSVDGCFLAGSEVRLFNFS